MTSLRWSGCLAFVALVCSGCPHDWDSVPLPGQGDSSTDGVGADGNRGDVAGDITGSDVNPGDVPHIDGSTDTGGDSSADGSTTDGDSATQDVMNNDVPEDNGCGTGAHPCNGVCVSSTSLSSCGNSCSACPSPTNGSSTCNGVMCIVGCDANYHVCTDSTGNAICADDTDPMHCGSTCMVCPGPTTGETSGSATCASTGCGIACSANFHMCGNACGDNYGPMTCGTNCSPCTAPTNATATCDGTSCSFQCNPGYAPSGTSCVVVPPQPIAPLSGASMHGAGYFHWQLTTGGPITGGSVEVCTNPTCTSVFATCTNASGTSCNVSTGLTNHDRTYFWHVYGTDSTGSRITTASPIWEFSVVNFTSVTNTSWGSYLDMNMDGYADAVVGGGGGNIFVYMGLAGNGQLPSGANIISTPATQNMRVASAGDVNGDGFVDFLVIPEGGTNVFLFEGVAGSAPPPSPAITLGLPADETSFTGTGTGVGDMDGDGYGDIALTCGSGLVYIYFGGPNGLPASPNYGATQAVAGFGNAIAGCDYNGDGLTDLTIAASGAVYIYPNLPVNPNATPARLNPASGNVSSIGCVGDVNADGFPDLAVGSANGTSGGTLYVYQSSGTAGIATGASPVTTITRAEENFGFSVDTAGDVNFDGKSDVAAGAAASSARGAFVFFGQAVGVMTTAGVSLTNPSGASSNLYGWTVTTIGDVNADGYPELAVTAPGTGTVYEYTGNGSVYAAAFWAGAPPYGGYGTSVAGLLPEESSHHARFPFALALTQPFRLF